MESGIASRSIHRVLRQFLLDTGWSHARVAAYLGTSRTSVYRWVNRQRDYKRTSRAREEALFRIVEWYRKSREGEVRTVHQVVNQLADCPEHERFGYMLNLAGLVASTLQAMFPTKVLRVECTGMFVSDPSATATIHFRNQRAVTIVFKGAMRGAIARVSVHSSVESPDAGVRFLVESDTFVRRCIAIVKKVM
jgi:hypothetical protein